MGFLNETAKVLGIDHTLNNQTFCQVFPSHGIVIEGFKKILALERNKIVICCQDNKTLELLGKNLTIKELSHKELSVLGIIETINFS